MRRTRLVIEVSDGILPAVYADGPTEVVVVDWHNINCGEPKPAELQFGDGSAPRSLMIRGQSGGVPSATAFGEGYASYERIEEKSSTDSVRMACTS